MIKEIFVHCSATPPEWMLSNSAAEQVAEIDVWHKKRGWRGFGYNELISRDGSRAAGRAIGETTAAATGHNKNAIHICLVGGKGSNATDHFRDHYTAEQEYALINRLRQLKHEYPAAVIRGHNEVAAKACPGFNVASWWADVQGNAEAETETTSNALAALISLIGGLFRGK